MGGGEDGCCPAGGGCCCLVAIGDRSSARGSDFSVGGDLTIDCGWSVGGVEEGCGRCLAGGGCCCAVAVGDEYSAGGCECLGCLVVEVGERLDWEEGSGFLVPGGRKCEGFLGTGGFLEGGTC